mmetsp:Transcript_12241/g.17403  ORF Transcript_12241/g.17403 Transcript_12241/m.17403 type:complete len:1247 (+) Transcript_12241:49-3789(+)
MNGDNNETFDLSVKMSQRLHDINLQKEKMQASINERTEQLQRLLAKGPKKSRETQVELDAKIDELEKKRTQTSLSLGKEKAILREIASVKRSKEKLKEFSQHESLVQERKNELSKFRDDLRNIIAQHAELDSALTKVELAKRLGCSTSDLETRIVDCPDTKLGQVIGKNGSNIKKLEEKTGCMMDVDKVKSQIHLHGSGIALNAAVEEIEKITLAIEISVKLSNEKHSYLFAMRMAAFNQLQRDHPNVYFDLSKDTKVLLLRGKPEPLALAKEAVGSIEVTEISKLISGRESSLIVGRNGSTVNQLTDQFNVGINLTNTKDGKSMVSVVGTPSNVQRAVLKIDEILYRFEDVEESIFVSAMVRNKLLSDSGAQMKLMQKEVNEICKDWNVFLYFEKLSKDEQQSSIKSLFYIKCARLCIEQAVESVKDKVGAYEDAILTMKVDTDIIPSIIGKGGSMISKLRKIGSGTEIEIDKASGEIKIFANGDDTKCALKNAIEQIIAENQKLKVSVDNSLFGFIFGAPGKEMRDNFQKEGVYILSDNSETHIILRGTKEKTKEAEIVLKDFLANNFSAEFKYNIDDEILLFNGGSSSIIHELQGANDVKITAMKSRKAVVFRGREEKVSKAIDSLKLYLYGGDGITVKKMKAPDNVLGFVIGKGGSNISKLQSAYNGVKVFLRKDSNTIVFRGPKDEVNKCHKEVVKLISLTKISISIRLSREQYIELSNSNVMKEISHDIPVQVELNEHSIKLRGTLENIRYAKALIEEQLKGFYTSSLYLDYEQYKKIDCKLSCEPTQFEHIQSSTDTSMSFNKSVCAIDISGKHSNVKRAKVYLLGLLEDLLPNQICRVKLAKPLVKKFGDTEALAKISEMSNCFVSLDRDLSCVIILDPSAQTISVARDMINERIADCKKLNHIIQIQQCDQWLISKLTGKYDESIKTIESTTKSKVTILRFDRLISISGESEQVVCNGNQMVEDLLTKLRRETVFVEIPGPAMSSFIGKAGSNIKKIEETNKVKIQRVKKTSKIKIEGNDTFVSAALLAIKSWIGNWEALNCTEEMIEINANLFPSVLQENAPRIKEIEEANKIKISANEKAHNLVICGGTYATRKSAASEVYDLVKETETMLVSEKEGQLLEQKSMEGLKGNISERKSLSIGLEDVGFEKNKHNDKSTNAFIQQNVAVAGINDKLLESPSKSKKGNQHSGVAAQSLYSLLVSDDDEKGLSNVKNQSCENSSAEKYIKSSSGLSIRL